MGVDFDKWVRPKEFWVDTNGRSEAPSMSTIDKQRIAAVRKLEQLGYTNAKL
jgi:hypothetical protein